MSFPPLQSPDKIFLVKVLFSEGTKVELSKLYEMYIKGCNEQMSAVYP